MKARFSPSRDRYYVILADRFASRTYSLKKQTRWSNDKTIIDSDCQCLADQDILLNLNHPMIVKYRSQCILHHERQINIRQLFANLNIEEHLNVSIGSF